MNEQLFKNLVDAIDQWSEDNCEGSAWGDQYWYTDQAKDMAKAAALVFDANAKGQKFAKDQEDC